MNLPTPQTFYRLARPDGWDFHTGSTVNCRENVGKDIRFRDLRRNGVLPSVTSIGASRTPDLYFRYAGSSIPCSMYRVRGHPTADDGELYEFEELHIETELDPAQVFKWKYTEACNPIRPFMIDPPRPGEEQIAQLEKWTEVRTSVLDLVRQPVDDSLGWSVWDAVMARISQSVGHSIWDAVWDAVEAELPATTRIASVKATLSISVTNSLWVYVGSLFLPALPGEKQEVMRQFQPCVELWTAGFVPSFDGKIWRLHGGPAAQILYETNTEI